MKFLSLFVLGCLSLAGLPSLVAAEAPCSSITRQVKMRSTEASAGLWANWRESDGSVKRESLRMFEEAKAKAPSLERPEDLCPANCILSQWPAMEFHSVPGKLLDDYSDVKKCENYFKKTSQKPLRYFKKLPRGIESLSAWVGEFSQGSGDLGEELYRVCDGSCSPQYHYLITVYPEYLTVEANVVCGHARDKSDNMYELSYSYRWSCIDK